MAITLQTLCAWLLHGWIFWEMASALCWKTHCGVQCAHLTCNDNNSCCLCLAFTVRFIYKHQLPMVLEDSTAKKPLLFVAIILQTLSMSILHAWIFWEMASALSWTIHCGVQCAHLLFNGNNTCCMCLVVITLQSLFMYSACSSAKFFAKHGQIKMNIAVFH